MNLRKKAFDILMRVFAEGAYSNLEIASALANVEPGDRKFITRLVYGTISYKIQADYHLNKFVSKPVEKLDLQVLVIMEAALYQKWYMDSVPDYAIINESVNLTKSCGKTSASGFVNGVLRKALKAPLDLSDVPENTAYYYSIKYSVPKKICSVILRQYKDKAENIIKECRREAPLTLRVNTLKTDSSSLLECFSERGINGVKSEICPDILKMEKGLSVGDDELFKNGFYYPQDEASALSAYMLSPSPGETIIDMCAAPGGKTTYLAQLMKNKGEIIAFDLYEHKIKIINDTSTRMGVDIINAQVSDATLLNSRFVGVADKIMADCPCSGYGIIRKKPEMGLEASSEADAPLEDIQLNILETASSYLKNGGVLVYSTCTINKKENIENIERFLEKHKEFEMCDIEEYLNGKTFSEQGKGWIQVLPGEYGMDGFFIAKMKKKEKDFD